MTTPAATAAMAAPAIGLPDLPPRFEGAGLSNPPPDYPRSARERGREGRVLLRVTVSESGAPDSVEVARSSGTAALDEAAVRTVRERWRFAPARRSGRPAAAAVEVPITFRLTD
ncbi:MAG TPA: energy transducer TonB [Alphaproteobacteria bacterium]|nr:energy transducer TonB [Alphaproteobacteria bacterium]